MTRRLLLSYLSVAAVVLLLLEVPLAVVFQQREMDRLSAAVERDANVLATIYEDALERGAFPDPGPAADYSRSTGARVVAVDRRGITIIDTTLGVDRDYSTRPEIIEALAGSRSVGVRPSTTLGTDLLYVAVPVASGGNVHGAVRLTLDTDDVAAQIHRFWLALAAVAVVVLIAVAGMGWAMARWLTQPIRRLQTTAERFAGGDLARAAPDSAAPEELLVLGETMNTMASRLDRLLGQQREFVADASHQLRTPLTALRLRLENLQSDATSPQQIAGLDRSIDEADRLARLVSDLLQLAQADSSPKQAVCDLRQLAADRVDTWTAFGEQVDVDIELLADDHEMLVEAVPGSIEQILDNLIDNAITASPAGGTVTVAISASSSVTQVVVRDQGPGLTDDQKQHAVERFWRAGSSTPGSGLGLAIVRSLVLGSRGSLELFDNEPSGLAVAVTFVSSVPAGSSRVRSRVS